MKGVLPPNSAGGWLTMAIVAFEELIGGVEVKREARAAMQPIQPADSAAGVD